MAKGYRFLSGVMKIFSNCGDGCTTLNIHPALGIQGGLVPGPLGMLKSRI